MVEFEVQYTAQRRSHPQSVVGERSGVETDEELDVTEVLGKVVQVRLEVHAAALFAGLDEHDATGVRYPVEFHCFDGAERGEGGIAVVGDAARVEPITSTGRNEGVETARPVAERWLLVEVPVEDDRAFVTRRRVDGNDEHGSATFEVVNLDVGVCDLSRTSPVGE